MKKIMFATDFYDHAPKVFEYAAELAYAFKADLLLMHVYGKPEPRLSTDQILAERPAKVIKRLTDFAAAHLPENYQETISLDYEAVNAYPLDGILDTALKHDVNLIVMGMTGKTNALGVVLGNTTLNVLAKADCQVLMIPDSVTYSGINRLLYTLDFEFRDLEAIHLLRKWSQVLKTELHALHVVEGDENKATVLRKMMIMKETFIKDTAIEFDLRYGNFKTEIEKFAREKEADIVAMISHKRNFISQLLDSSSLEGVAKRINLPLLVIKEDAYEFDESTWQWVKFFNSIA